MGHRGQLTGYQLEGKKRTDSRVRPVARTVRARAIYLQLLEAVLTNKADFEAKV